MPKLGIIMAVYNEKDSLMQVLAKIENVDLGGIEKEIVIVDGCSTDGTRQLLENLARPNVKIIFEERKKGKGSALREGFAKSGGDIFLIQDADLEIDPADYPALLKPILEGECDVVYGSRFLKGKGNDSFLHYFGNRLVSMAANILFGARLTDLETCYKVFRPQVIKEMQFFCNGFDFDAELTSLVLKKGTRIKEVPISYNPRNRSEGKKVHWTEAIKSLITIIKCRFR